jgi:glycerate-2-kinase
MGKAAQITAEAICRGALERVRADRLVREHLSLDGDTLWVGPQRLDLQPYKRVRLLALGKAAVPMADGAAEVLGKRLNGGLAVTKHEPLEAPKGLEVMLGDHPVPSERSLEAGDALIRFAREADERTLVIGLVSGGASALAEKPREGIGPGTLRETTDQLLKSGANIDQINAIRKRLSQLKAGGLAETCRPAKLVALVLSDVVGGDPATVGSGPFLPLPLPPLEPEPWMHENVARCLRNPPERPGETPYHQVIADHATLAAAAETVAREKGFVVERHPEPLTQNAEDVAETMVKAAKRLTKGGVWIATGEPTVKVEGHGKGGRAQHIAMLAAPALQELKQPVAVLAAGSDGNDGPTDMAGAVVDNLTYRQAAHLSPAYEKAVQDFDSYAWCRAADAHLFTGPTGTNLNDLFLVVKPLH